MSKKCYQYKLEDVDYKFINVFKTQTLAANSVGVAESQIRQNLNTGVPFKGYEWWDEDSHRDYCLDRFGTEYHPNEVAFKPKTFDDQILVPAEHNGARILFLDIETSLMKGYFFGLYDVTIGKKQLIQHWHCLCWSCKWLGYDDIISDRLTSEEAKSGDDYRIMQNLWTMMDHADVIVAHNGDKFDIKKINTRFIVHNMLPPSPYRTIDTLKVAKKHFGFSSNRLDFINEQLGLPCKTETNMKLWVDCMKGDEAALNEMEQYNRNDVAILEQTYLKLRPYIKGHINLGMYNDEEYCCPNCSSTKLELTDKQFTTQSVVYKVYRCKECGALARSKKGFKSVKKQLMAIPR